MLVLVVGVGSIFFDGRIPNGYLRFYLNYIPRYIIFLAIVLFYGYLFRYLRGHVMVLRAVGQMRPELVKDESDEPIPNNVAKYRKIMRLMLLYPIVYLCLWIFPSINRIVDLTYGPVLWLTVY